jgi:transposase InsO family protein
MYRVRRERGQADRRGCAGAPRPSRPPTTYRAAGPCELWRWEIIWLPGPALGAFFPLSLILDWRRKITGWEVHDRESGARAARMIEQAVWAEGCVTRSLTLPAESSPMKAAIRRLTPERLGGTASDSRPRVSTDNPFPAALFRPCKSVPTWPERGFASLAAARVRGTDFVGWTMAGTATARGGSSPPTSAIASRIVPSSASATPSSGRP